MSKPNDVYAEERNGYQIRIVVDEDPDSPRGWSNLGTMICEHGRYELGDSHRIGDREFFGLRHWIFLDEPNCGTADNSTEEAFLKFVNQKDVVALPLYLYDHSGITMNTRGFSCPWDSGQVGYIYVTDEKIKKEYGVKRISKQLHAKVEGYLRGEVETYDQYLTGQVYGYVIEKDGEEVHSCWGFYSDYDGYVLNEARSVVDYKHSEESK